MKSKSTCDSADTEDEQDKPPLIISSESAF